MVFLVLHRLVRYHTEKWWEENALSISNRRWKSIKMTKISVVWLKSAGLKSFMRSAKPNVIIHTFMDLPPHPLLSFHSSLDPSLSPELFMPGSEKWMHLPKGAEVEEREVSHFDRYSLMMKVTEGFESSRKYRWRDGSLWQWRVIVCLRLLVYTFNVCM